MLIKQETEIEKKFSTFRAQAGDQSLTDNEVDDILQNSNDSKQLQTVWEAHKKVGALVAEDVRELARLRNKIAKEVGFENYHTMSLTLSEQNPSDIEKLFDELDVLTRPAFMEVKNEIDEYLSSALNITKDQLRPWHYKNKFFQEFPSIYPGLNFDSYFKDQNIENLSKDFFASIDIDVTSIVARSDLYEKP
jgi:peptidyl-dipeptidase A